MLFLRRAHGSDRPPLDYNPLPTDCETRALTIAPPGTVEKESGIIKRVNPSIGEKLELIKKLESWVSVEHICRLARMSVLDTEVDGSNPGSSMLFP